MKKFPIITLLYAGVIYSTIPIIRPIINFLISQNLLRITIATFSISALISMFLLLKKYTAIESKKVITLMLATSFIYTSFLLMIENYAERLHLLQYGVMGILCYKSIEPYSSYKYRKLFALLLASLIGAGDELIQWITPERYFEFRDIALNAFSAALGLILLSVIQHMDPNTTTQSKIS